MLDDLCSRQSANDPPSNNENAAPAAKQIEVSTKIPRIRTPSPIVIINKVATEATVSSTSQQATQIRERWISDETLISQGSGAGPLYFMRVPSKRTPLY